MKISYHTAKDNLDMTRGFGAAGFRVVTSLQELGHTVPFDDPEAPVQISFNHPHAFKFHPGQYKIGYVPWESTDLPEGWKKILNDCDEVWATSPWLANLFEVRGVKNVSVYQHGLDSKWSPKKRQVGDVIKFLHIGEPALRKGGQMALDAFREVFGDREDVHLTIKAYNQNFLRSWQNGIYGKPEYNNVTIIDDNMHFAELQKLYYDHDVMIYPSYGEGFGLIPLQALGTGMPVICTTGWAPYAKYIGPLSLGGQWNRSIWSIHPGNVFYPDYDELKDLLEFMSQKHMVNFMHERFYNQAQDVANEYNWNRLTEEAFAPVVSRFTKS
jgi:glycosyltransferase involved in cell wall biosynthesis